MRALFPQSARKLLITLADSWGNLRVGPTVCPVASYSFKSAVWRTFRQVAIAQVGAIQI